MKYFVSPKGLENWTQVSEKQLAYYNPREYDIRKEKVKTENKRSKAK